jgi:hypothetical protein
MLDTTAADDDHNWFVASFHDTTFDKHVSRNGTAFGALVKFRERAIPMVWGPNTLCCLGVVTFEVSLGPSGDRGCGDSRKTRTKCQYL